MENEELMNEELPKKNKYALWLENYWYHYKLHTIAAVFVLTVVCIVAFQMCTRPSYDIYIMYAGGKVVNHTNAETDTYTNIVSSLRRVALDYDENGEAAVNLSTLYLPSAKELEELEENELLDAYTPLIKSDRDTFNSNLMLSEFYICFLSEELFLERDKNQNTSNQNPMYPFADLIEYTSDEKKDTYEYVEGSTRGIYLRSTDFYGMPGICELPEDTVIAFRIRSSLYGSDKNIEYYESCEQVLRNMLAYTPIGE